MALRLTILLLALAAVAPAAASASEVIVVGADGETRRVDDPLLPPPEATDPTGGEAYCAADGRRAPKVNAAPRVQAAATSVTTALSRARRSGAISAGEYATYRDDWSDGRSAIGRLSGTRRSEQRAVTGTLTSIAARGRLTPSRMPALFLTLRRNTQYWTSGKPLPLTPPPGPRKKRPCAGQAGQGGARVTFAGDPIIFQWYRGQGLQIQPLGNFGQANALWKRCVDKTPDPDTPCDREALERMLDRLADLASTRSGFRTWEYYFHFGGGVPPWTSGLSQGTGIQAFARGYQLLGKERYKRIGRAAVGAFEKPPPAGVRVRSGSGSHYLIYSMSPGLRVLNGFLQAVTGLYDFAKITGDKRAMRLFRAGDRAARREIPRYDTGAWSRYSEGGRESDLGYHRLVRDFIGNLCDRTKASIYCRTEKRFTAYTRRPTVVRVSRPSGARVGNAVPLRFSLSKVSCVTVRVFRDGERVFYHRRVLGRGRHVAFWTPPQRGTHEVRVEAIDLNNHKVTVPASFEVR